MTTRPVVFMGPTLPLAEARQVLDATYLPPAAHGDVLRAALTRPPAIAVVDGVFDRLPSIWHKEILWALSEGIPVYGSSSMGALRAAELAAFGMRGIGEVFEAYADGTLEDDDEVAVAHAGPDDGYRPLSDAMVDVRATLGRAVEEGVVSPSVADELLRRVKATFYADRRLTAALDDAEPAHVALRTWLATGRVPRKRDDALALLATVRDDLASGLPPVRPPWVLQRTRFWEEARIAAELAPEDADADDRAEQDDLADVLDEVRLDPARYGPLATESLLVALARHEAARAGVDHSAWATQVTLDEVRLADGLLAGTEVDTWLATRGLADHDLDAVVQRWTVLRWAHSAHRNALAGELVLSMRTSGELVAVSERAARKREALAVPSTRPVPSDETLLAWYFGEVLGRDVPAAPDVWARANGWPRRADLVRALRREWQFRAR